VRLFIRYKVIGNLARGMISAPGADIIPKWKYIRTWSADITKLGETAAKKQKEVNHEAIN